MIEYKTFNENHQDYLDESKTIESINKWRLKNPTVRLINVETLMTPDGVLGASFRLAGFRVWFESGTNERQSSLNERIQP